MSARAGLALGVAALALAHALLLGFFRKFGRDDDGDVFSAPEDPGVRWRE